MTTKENHDADLMQATQRLTELEVKIAFQDKLLEDLNEVVYKQQLKLDELEKMSKELLKKMGSDIDPAHTKPPHY